MSYSVKQWLVVNYDNFKNPTKTYVGEFGVVFFRETLKKVDNVYKYYYDECGDVYSIITYSQSGHLEYNSNQKMYYIDGKNIIKDVQTNEDLYILDESLGICYLADGITKFGIILKSDFVVNKDSGANIPNILNNINGNRVSFLGKNVDDYLDETLTANTSFEKTLGLSNKIWNLKDDESVAEDQKYMILAKDTNELIGCIVCNKNKAQIYDNDGKIFALVEQKLDSSYSPGGCYGYPVEITEEGQRAKYKYYINNFNVDRIEFCLYNQKIYGKGELIGYFYTFDEYDWPTPPPPEPTDDDITAICITNRELHLKKVKQPNKLGNLYIITTRAKKKK